MNCDGRAVLDFDTSRAKRYSNVEVGIALPYVYIRMGQKTFGEHIALCAQDCSQFAGGAHTGDVSAHMLQDSGVSYVILGHSERRHGLGESGAVLEEKLRCCLEAGLGVILCVGETLEQRECGKTAATVEGQLKTLRRCQRPEKISIAYEPVWAIGSGKHLEEKGIEAVIECIKKAMAGLGISSRVLYGGSVNRENCAELAGIRGLDGFLVGNASLTTELFDIADSLEH
ncbi:UNVERIFIED_CONTAM: hypothetical protein PYX00_010808 [Menopon gallinae]|uniref:Triosephosphate isomerase n=1 Tax=Menopon gallinae TaxID=328185 RepID=A0AAW2H6G7_9NEOP